MVSASRLWRGSRLPEMQKEDVNGLSRARNQKSETPRAGLECPLYAYQ